MSLRTPDLQSGAISRSAICPSKRGTDRANLYFKPRGGSSRITLTTAAYRAACLSMFTTERREAFSWHSSCQRSRSRKPRAMGSPSGLAPEFPGSQPGVLLLDDDEHTNKKEAPTESARLPYGNNLAVNYVRISALTKNKLNRISLCCMANQTGLDSQPSSGCCISEPRDPAGLKLRLGCELEYIMVGISS